MVETQLCKLRGTSDALYVISTGIVFVNYFVNALYILLRQVGQIEQTGEEQQNATKCGPNRVGADQSSENREVPVDVRPETG